MPNSTIKSIKAREILDSRGNPTVEVELETDFGKFLASVPSGTSKGKYEAVELRDEGKRYQGMGVLRAIKNINEIIGPKLIGEDPTNQKKIDEILVNLDGTGNKSKLGANAVCPLSMVVCRAGAKTNNLPLYKYISQTYQRAPAALILPTPCFNVIEGGAHAGNELDFQEFMIVPQEKSFSENFKIGKEIYHKLKEILFKKYGKKGIQLGDERGFAPPTKFPEEAIELILEAVKNRAYKKDLCVPVKIILDVAASQFFSPPRQKFGGGGKNGKYKMKIGVFTKKGLLKYYEKLISSYPISGLEDPFAEDDFKGWQILSSKFKVQSLKFLVIGDDLTVTNLKRIKLAKEKNACNAAIIKINQIGTVTEALEAARLAKEFDWKIIVSHRAGETLDDFIADLATGIGADFIKAGSPSQKERMAKYKRLLKIEEELKKT